VASNISRRARLGGCYFLRHGDHPSFTFLNLTIGNRKTSCCRRFCLRFCPRFLGASLDVIVNASSTVLDGIAVFAPKKANTVPADPVRTII
jgi:hypothetical protein